MNEATYDLHTHFIPRDVLLWLEDNEKRVHAVREKKAGCQAEFLTVNHKWGFELKELFYQEALYLEAQQEAEDGVTSISAPVRNHAGRVLYAVSVVGPAKRIKARQAKIIYQVKQAARDISERIGYWKRI
ncbi:hypothetical protein DT075_00545 [Bacillus licheniformis]|nr:hypothetical protein DT075_00545 [Bacillus licheniformis]